MKEIILYTDGACSYNPGPGGWGCVLIYKNTKKELSGGEPETTNNRMELQAVISGLEALKEKCKVDIFTDSAYVCNAFQQDWISGWIKKNWKNAKKDPVANKDLWLRLLDLCGKHNVVWHKVKGHADNELNNRCDELARMEVEKILSAKNSQSPEPIE
ncbi:MAG: ribonuclease HI [Clostridia bacterium]|nr:ribonuclease HI [Clostridia bacterium]